MKHKFTTSNGDKFQLEITDIGKGILTSNDFDGEHVVEMVSVLRNTSGLILNYEEKKKILDILVDDFSRNTVKGQFKLINEHKAKNFRPIRFYCKTCKKEIFEKLDYSELESDSIIDMLNNCTCGDCDLKYIKDYLK